MSPAGILTPFQSRNFRLYFAGQVVSLLGSWMTNTATVWLVYQMTGSPVWLGIITLITQAPVVLIGPFAGVWVDRVDRLRLLQTTQMLAMLQSAVLAGLMFAGSLNIWILAALAFFQGMVTAVDLPTRQSLAVVLAERRDQLAGVIGLTSSMFNLARLVGPALAGIIIATWGAAVCFTIDALSYLAVLAALAAMRLPESFRNPRGNRPAAGVMHDLGQGVRYLLASVPIRSHVLLTGAMAGMTMSYATLMPVYAERFFDGDARTLGFLMASTAAGSLAAALYLASRKHLAGIGSAILTGALMAGTALMIFSASRSLWVSCVCLAVTGAGGILVLASNNTLVQSMVEESKRGRVMSLYTVVFLGSFPVGSLLTGWIAARFGPGVAAFCNGLAAILIAAVYMRLRPLLRTQIRDLIRGHEPEIP